MYLSAKVTYTQSRKENRSVRLVDGRSWQAHQVGRGGGNVFNQITRCTTFVFYLFFYAIHD